MKKKINKHSLNELAKIMPIMPKSKMKTVIGGSGSFNCSGSYYENNNLKQDNIIVDFAFEKNVLDSWFNNGDAIYKHIASTIGNMNYGSFSTFRFVVEIGNVSDWDTDNDRVVRVFDYRGEEIISQHTDIHLSGSKGWG